MRRSVFFVFIAVLVVASIGLILLTLMQPAKESKTETKKVAPFRISGLANPDYAFTSDNQKDITQSIKNFLTADHINTTNLEGKVRESSYKEEAVNDGLVATVLIDLPSVKRTYKVSSSHDADGYEGLYVTCPANEELIYGSFNCKDDSNG